MRRRVLILLTIIVALFSGIDSYAQRNRKKQGISNSTKLREAEYYFTEGEKYYILEDYARALALFQRSIELDPDNATSYYKRAQIEFENDDISQAEEDAEKALEMDPSNKYFYLLVIEIYSQQGEFDKALEKYDSMITRIPGANQYLYEVAAIYLFQNKMDMALKTFDRLEKIYGVSNEIGLQRHRIYAQMGKTEAAIKELETLISRNPSDPNYSIAIADYYLSLNETQNALKSLQETLEIYPGNPRAALILGEIYRQDNKFKEASPQLKLAFENTELSSDLKIQLIAQYKTISPSRELYELIEDLCIVLTQVHADNSNVFAIYGDFLAESDRKELAAKQYEQSIRLDDSNFNVWQNLIVVYNQINDFEKVIKTADRALVIFPNQTSLYYLSGFAHVRTQLYKEAIQLLLSGRRITGENKALVSDFNSLLGEAYNGTKDYEKSDEAFEAVLAVQPKNYIVLNNYSYYLSIRGDHLEKAEKMSAQLVRENPDNINFLDTYAWVLYARNKFKEAKKVAEKALDSGKAKAVHFEHYGDILFKLGDIDEAVIQWQKAKGMDSSLYLIDKKIADRKLYEK